MSGEPFRLRALWWIMVRAERLAGWCRARWLRWHETRGVVLPGKSTPGGYERPTLKKLGKVAPPRDG